jgi:2-C-methyl-D-erythritol 2,4-cyclodiphosphate synthase
MKIGFGYDSHRLEDGRKLIIGGVDIPFEKGLLGHSDADVLIHAVCDAIIGAAGKGDIGKHFPDSDPAFKDISSMILLKRVADIAAENGYQVCNIDATVVLEKPKMASYLALMSQNIADALSISPLQVNVKAKTNEGMGMIGVSEGAVSFAVVSLKRLEL